DPADVGREEMHRAERGPNAAGLPLPVLAPVDRVPDDPFIAHRPAFVAIDELHRAQGSVIVMTQIGTAGAGCKQGAQREREQNESHNLGLRVLTPTGGGPWA